MRSRLLPTNSVVGTSAENRPSAFERVVATVTQESPTRRSTRTGRAVAGRTFPLTRRSPAVRTDSDDGSSATEAGGPAAPAAVTGSAATSATVSVDATARTADLRGRWPRGP